MLFYGLFFLLQVLPGLGRRTFFLYNNYIEPPDLTFVENSRREKMRTSRIVPITLIFIFSVMAFSINGCRRPPSDDDHDPIDRPVSVEPVDISGANPRELISKWAELGENDQRLRYWMQEDLEGILIDLKEWHIERISSGETKTCDLELDADMYDIRGFGGRGLANLDMTIYYGNSPSDDNLLDIDDKDDSIPMLYFKLIDTMSLTLEVEAVEFEEGYDDAYFCWYVYVE